MDRDAAEPRVDALPGERAREWARFHDQVAAPSTHVYDFVWDVTAEAAGPFCTDVDGNVLLDFTCHVASAPLGYDNAKITDRIEALGLPDPTKFAGQDFYASGGWPPDDPEFPGPTQLMHRLVELTPDGLDTVFLSNTGAEAVENAIKICYDHRDGARRAVTFDGAFHGRTLGALSLNRSKAVHSRHFPSIEGVHDVPYCDDRHCEPATCSCGFFPDGEPSRLRRKLDPNTGHVDPDEVAYVIVEPIQGEGGYRLPSDAFTDEVAAVCDDHSIPLIADEVQTGLGRTGEWWGSDHYAIEPDVFALGKALRVGATVASDEVFPDEKGRLSSTWGGGDVLSALQGVLTIDAIREYDLLDNAVERGRSMRERLRDAGVEHAVDVRGKGLLLAVEFDTKSRRDAVLECCFQRGLLTLPCGHETLRLLPPLDVTEREIEMGADLLLDAVDDPVVENASPSFPVGDDAI